PRLHRRSEPVQAREVLAGHAYRDSSPREDPGDASGLRPDLALEPKGRGHGATLLYPKLGWPVRRPDPGRQGISVTFTETPLRGAFVIEPELLEDRRGLFTRTWCRREFEAHGLEIRIAQCSTSFNKKKGTLRGLHHEVPPF